MKRHVRWIVEKREAFMSKSTGKGSLHHYPQCRFLGLARGMPQRPGVTKKFGMLKINDTYLNIRIYRALYIS
jgi:hypothetical protein